jgi:glutamate synthase domain-containing protein 3
MVDLEQVNAETEGVDLLWDLIAEHARLTGSAKARSVLADWQANLKKFVKVFPREYRRALLERAAKLERV